MAFATLTEAKDEGIYMDPSITPIFLDGARRIKIPTTSQVAFSKSLRPSIPIVTSDLHVSVSGCPR